MKNEKCHEKYKGNKILNTKANMFPNFDTKFTLNF